MGQPPSPTPGQPGAAARTVFRTPGTRSRLAPRPAADKAEPAAQAHSEQAHSEQAPTQAPTAYAQAVQAYIEQPYAAQVYAEQPYTAQPYTEQPYADRSSDPVQAAEAEVSPEAYRLTDGPPNAAASRPSRTWLAVVLLVLAVAIVVSGFSAIAWISGEAVSTFVDRVVSGTAT